MTVEYLRFEVEPQQTAAFEQAFSAAMQLLDTDETVLDYNTARSLDEAGKYTIRIEWQSREAQIAYKQKDDYKLFMQYIMPFVNATKEMKFYEIIQSKK